MNNKDYKEGFFPRFVDRPRLIGMFEIDEAGATFAIVVVLIAASLATPSIGSLEVILAGLFLGGSFGYFYKKFKKNRANGYTFHKLYKIGAFHPTDNKMVMKKYPYLKKEKAIPYGFTKEFYN